MTVHEETSVERVDFIPVATTPIVVNRQLAFRLVTHEYIPPYGSYVFLRDLRRLATAAAWEAVCTINCPRQSPATFFWPVPTFLPRSTPPHRLNRGPLDPLFLLGPLFLVTEIDRAGSQK